MSDLQAGDFVMLKNDLLRVYTVVSIGINGCFFIVPIGGYELTMVMSRYSLVKIDMNLDRAEGRE